MTPVYVPSARCENKTTTLLPVVLSLETHGRHFQFIDTPGFLPINTMGSSDEIRAVRAQDILLRNRGRIDRLKDPLPLGTSVPRSALRVLSDSKAFTYALVSNIVLRAIREDLIVFYNTPAFMPGDVGAFLTALARKNGITRNVRVYTIVYRFLSTHFIHLGWISGR